MYAVAAAWKMHYVPGSWLEQVEEQVMPFLRALPGFERVIFTRDDATGVNHSLTIFADRAGAEHLRALDAAPERQAAREGAGVEPVGTMAVVQVLAELEQLSPAPA